MSGISKTFNTGLRLGLVTTSALAISACAQLATGPGAEATRAGGDTMATQSVQLVERDVEAPEVFQATDAGLWDGRPSLGGVWVAHPDVAEPERVIIRNQENGTFVIGALFRRERENPGPLIQVSSDAAAALEMLAGAPATLQVTALRREEAATPQPNATTDFDAPAEIAATTLDGAPVELAVDALDVATEPSAEIVEAALVPVTETTDAMPRLQIPADLAAYLETSPEVTNSADPIAVAAAALDAAVATAPNASPVPAPRPVSASASPLPKPYIQIGIFAVEDNANRTADGMRAIGIVPTVLQQEGQRTFWRVIIGPATNEAERAELLEKVRAQGFEDAYFVTD